MNIPMSTNNICFYKKVDKTNTGCYLKTTRLLDCELIGACAKIRLNMVGQGYQNLISFLLCPNYISIKTWLRIQPLVHKILCRQDSVMPVPTPKSICPSLHQWGDIITLLFTLLGKMLFVWHFILNENILL